MNFQFSINQIGYSCAAHGCTHYIIQVVYINKDGNIESEVFQCGPYEDREYELADFFKNKGYTRTYVAYGANSKYTKKERKYIGDFDTSFSRIQESV